MSFISNLADRLIQKRKQRYLRNLKNRGLEIGTNVKIIDAFFFDPSHCYLISIGDNCTICPNVRLIAHDASTFQFLGYTKLGRIRIGANCFIGDSVIVLPNVTIGEGCIVGAGSVVTKDIPPHSIAAGNPARVIGGVKAYLERMKALQAPKTVFGEDYWIHRLDREKLQQLLDSVGDSIGFIV